MSNQETLSKTPNEMAMRVSFEEQATVLLSQLERFRKTGLITRCGLEVEYGLIERSDWNQCPQKKRDDIIARTGGYADVELGAAQIEIRTEPFCLEDGGSEVLLDQLESRDATINQHAQDLNLYLISHGTNPFVATRGIERTALSKYVLVPNHHNNYQRSQDTFVGNGQKIDIGDAAIIGITNSVQANIEAADAGDAVDMVNRSFAIGPMAVSFFANARFLEGKDTGIQDIRMIAWEISHDTRNEDDLKAGNITRVGLPGCYYDSLNGYFDHILKYPFILDAPEAAMAVGIGLNWQDSRIKVIGDSLVAEFRPVSTQATPQLNFCAMMFYVGRLLWAKDHQEQLLPMIKVQQNRNEAMYFGSQAKLWTNVGIGIKRIPAGEAKVIEVKRAEEALASRGILTKICKDALSLLHKMTKSGSEVLAEKRETFVGQGADDRCALFTALEKTGGIR
ncbi:hypothetical protein KJ909_00145 [Patescibacteria group bacterium]|nr:hypothetical protein [Patescibacteria group bacterium]